MAGGSSHERSPLLASQQEERDEEPRELLEFDKDDTDNPRNWTTRKKLGNVAIIALMAILSPLASSMFNPGIKQIATDLDTSETAVVGATTGFIAALGLGPLILAPLSETFGRRRLYLTCFSVFSLLQIPTALSPSIGALITFRTISAFFGSVGIANGGGTISDMFAASGRARVQGWYLLGPILGPVLGPLLGGVIVQYLGWRWIFGVLAILCTTNTLAAFFFLKESYAPTILASRKAEFERNSSIKYYFPGEDLRPVRAKVLTSMHRPLKILFTQPIVLIMAAYQAILYGTMYALYVSIPGIFGEPPYNFSSSQVGLVYLAPGLGGLIAVLIVIPRIDTVFDMLTERHGGVSRPEFRLPLANIGILIPLSLLWVGWCAEKQLHWFAVLASMPFFATGQQVVFSAVQNYYIDAFERYAASAIAAGGLFRSIVGGVIPVIAPGLFGALGYGWGISLLAFLSLALAPSPVLFYYYGERLRTKFAINL